MKRESGRFSQQAINRIAEIAIASQLKQDVEISVNIVTTLNQLTKGQIDAIAILIQGLVLSGNLKTQEFQLNIGEVTVKPLSAVKGRIKLLHPSQGKLRVVIDEESLTAALNTSMQRDYPQGETASPQPHQSPAPIRCVIADDGMTVRFNPDDPSAAESIGLAAVPQAEAGIDWQPLSDSNQANPEWLADVLTQLEQLLSLKDFEQKGLFLSVEEIQMADGKLQLDANALIQAFPPD